MLIKSACLLACICTDLLSPWWIAAMVAGSVIVLIIILVSCMFLCRWNDGAVCYDPESWLACCITLRFPRDQPYRRRRRTVHPAFTGSHGSIDRTVYIGIYATGKARFPLPELRGDRFPLPLNTGLFFYCLFSLKEYFHDIFERVYFDSETVCMVCCDAGDDSSSLDGHTRVVEYIKPSRPDVFFQSPAS